MPPRMALHPNAKHSTNNQTSTTGDVSMRRAGVVAALGLLVLMACWFWRTQPVQAQKGSAAAQWIWYDEGDPAQEAPAEPRYFRRVFVINRDVQKPVDEAELDITADNQFTVWVNGHLVGKGDRWE